MGGTPARYSLPLPADDFSTPRTCSRCESVARPYRIYARYRRSILCFRFTPYRDRGSLISRSISVRGYLWTRRRRVYNKHRLKKQVPINRYHTTRSLRMHMAKTRRRFRNTWQIILRVDMDTSCRRVQGVNGKTFGQTRRARTSHSSISEKYTNELNAPFP